MRELSIHVDESGDFGYYNSKYALYYIFTLVFHEQENDITENITLPKKRLLPIRSLMYPVENTLTNRL